MKTWHLIATGVGILAATTVASAAVVAVSLPEPLEITTFFDDSFPLDVDQNGSKDFIFFATLSGSSVQPLGYNRVAIERDPPPDLGGPLTAFQPGALIGADIAFPLEFRSADHFGDGFVEEGELLAIGIVICFDFCSYTPFAAGRAYAGFEFERNGLKHYGYFDMSGAPNVRGVAIYGWAWETEPGVPIIAGAIPEPSIAAYVGVGTALLLKRNGHIRKQNKSLLQTAMVWLVSTLHFIRRCFGIG